jgi:basic membrane protein A and related proteins
MMAKLRNARMWVALALIALFAAVPVAPTGAATGKLKVAAALPGIITDKAWNQSAYEGLKMVEKELGAQIAYTERVAQADQVEVLSDYARRNFDLIFAHGGEFDAAGKQVAAMFPKTKFVIDNGTNTGPNLADLQINHFQVAFLGGFVAGKMSKTNKVAVVAAEKFKAIEDLVAGYTQGAKHANPQTEVFVTFTGDWDNVGKGKEAALAHIAKGADVVMPILDHALVGVIDAVKEKNVYGVGYVADQLSLAPKNILTSVMENMSVAIFTMAKNVAAGRFEGTNHVIGLENPQVARLGTYNSVVPQDVRSQVEDLKQQLISKKITQQ